MGEAAREIGGAYRVAGIRQHSADSRYLIRQRGRQARFFRRAFGYDQVCFDLFGLFPRGGFLRRLEFRAQPTDLAVTFLGGPLMVQCNQTFEDFFID